MNTSSTDYNALAKSGIMAWRDKDYARATQILESVVNAGRADTLVWMGLAYVYRDTGRTGDMAAVVDKALKSDPRNVRMLLLKADYLHDKGDLNAAVAFYDGAVKCAGALGQHPPELQQEIRRAQTRSAEIAAIFEKHLRDTLAREGVDESRQTPRFKRSLDIATGKTVAFYQSPTRYFFPELPQIQFYDRGAFDWAPGLEASTDEIRGEMLNVLREDALLRPYIENNDFTPHLSDLSLVDNPAWSAFFLWEDGALVEENAARCPKTVAALSKTPLAKIDGAMPSVLFSVLRPGARIPPHHGLVNTRLICHLPLVVPQGCALRVGNETRQWRDGELVIFDDSIEHEAWNNSGETRVVLLFDIWRPELSEEERVEVAAMFKAVSRYAAGAHGAV